jgi:hypothetical protein
MIGSVCLARPWAQRTEECGSRQLSATAAGSRADRIGCRAAPDTVPSAPADPTIVATDPGGVGGAVTGDVRRFEGI